MWHRHSYAGLKRYLDYFAHGHPIFSELEKMPAIVSHSKINRLRDLLGQCEKGLRVMLHTGDCAESFDDLNQSHLERKVSFYEQMRRATRQCSKLEPVLVGRIAGQYAKPRSSEFVTKGNQLIHNYKGDIINGISEKDREPDPQRILQGYFHSVVTHNFLQNQMQDLFVSHEGLILPYEAALTKLISNRHYCLSAHMIWIGERTRQLDGAHIEFFRGLQNPVGVKVSDKISKEDFLKLITTLNPQNQQGKLLVIVRMGAKSIAGKLEDLIEVKLKNKLHFLFVSDPMHGNTYECEGHKLKTRKYEHILDEMHYFKKTMIHYGIPFGLSTEATFQNVTECHGGEFPLSEAEIDPKFYLTKCDPRLNFAQMNRFIQDAFK